MANVSYPQYKLTDIILPIEHGDYLSLEEYKQKYGIDIKKLLDIQIDGDNIICLFQPFNRYYIVDVSARGSIFPPTAMITLVGTQEYDEGSVDAYLMLAVEDINGDSGFGIFITCSKDSDLTLDNIKVKYFEI